MKRLLCIIALLLLLVGCCTAARREATVRLRGGTNYTVDELLKHIQEFTGRDTIPAPNILGRRIRIEKDMEVNFEQLKALLELNAINLHVVTDDDRTYYVADSDRILRR